MRRDHLISGYFAAHCTCDGIFPKKMTRTAQYAADAAKTSCRVALVMIDRVIEKATTKIIRIPIFTPADVCKT